MLKQLDTSHINRHLGQSSKYVSQYDRTLLVREPRAMNRTQLDINCDKPPFRGYDIWNGYEISGLLDNGRPFAAIAKVVYPATNKFIVESKSMKLYWNSFNNTTMGETVDAAIKAVEERAAADLSELLETNVRVVLFKPDHYNEDHIPDFYNFINLENSFDVECSVYTETPELLKYSTDNTMYTYDNRGIVRFKSSLLKSNCKITSQPDWGDIFIQMTPDNKYIEPESLLQYIVSFRNECHFHEEICETVYKRLLDIYVPKELFVMCAYTRRGGWDIVPIRASHDYLLPSNLIQPSTMWTKTSRQ